MPLAAAQGAWPPTLSWGPGRLGQLLSPPLPSPSTPTLMQGGLYSGGALVLKRAHGGVRHLKITDTENRRWVLVEREKAEGIRRGRGLRVTNYSV